MVIITAVFVFVILYLLIRDYRVFILRRLIFLKVSVYIDDHPDECWTDLYVLPEYEKMLWSFKSLKEENWLPEEICEKLKV